MHHSLTLISTLAFGLGLALIFGFLATRLRMPPLVGYLFAGVLIGPGTPGFVADMALSSQLAEIGVILLMFGVGLHFSVKDLLAVKAIAIPGALIQIVFATAMGATMAHYWQWPLGEGLVFGLALSVASTVVLLRALESRGLLASINGKIAIGWLVVEDMVMVLVLVLLPALASLLTTGSGSTATTSENTLGLDLALTLGKIGAFIGLMLILGRRLFPKLLWWVARTGSRELFTLCVVATALGVAYGAAMLFDVSFALGAFFAGMMMRESEYSHRAADESLPLRDAFSVLFFVSVGMLFDPRILLQEPVKLLAVVAIILIGKTLVAAILVLLLRYPLNTALTVAVSLAQIGEFSFILIGLGQSLGLMGKTSANLVLAGALISISLNSLLFALVEPAQAWIRKKSALARRLECRDDPLAALPMDVDQAYLTGQIVLVGYGRIGRQIANWLRGQEVHFVVAEQKRNLVELLRAQDIPAVSGDASEAATLIQAHIHKASHLIITLPDALQARQMVDIARTLNPQVEVLLLAGSTAEAEMMHNDGLGEVFLSEWEMAKNMANHALKKYGKSIDLPPT
jgi:monovalent cation:H+ antiporter-2, CPA2 family